MWKKRLIQFSLFWLYTLFALILPCVVIIDKFGLFVNPDGKKWALGLILAVVIALFYFRKNISKGIENLTPCVLKSILMALKEMMPLIIMFGAFYGAYYVFSRNVESIIYICKWTCIFNVIGYVIRVVHLWYVDKVREFYQIGLVKQGLNSK